MHDRCRRFAAVSLAAFAAALPALAGAQSAPAGNVRLNFVPPKGWTDTSRPNERAGVWKDWTVRDGGAVHSIVLSLTRESRPAAAYGPVAADFLKGAANVTLLESGATTTCGDVPAYTYTYRSERTPGHPMIIRHVIVDVGPLLGDVSYAHPPEAADRADARDAMSTFCEQQIYAPRGPAAWRAARITSIGDNVIDVFAAPSGGGKLIALAVAAPANTQPKVLSVAQLGPGAALIDDAEETCGTTHVRRTRYRTKSGADTTITETLSGYRHGASYTYSYTRPETTPLDPEAQLALASFCDAGATLATPLPSPRPPA